MVFKKHSLLLLESMASVEIQAYFNKNHYIGRVLSFDNEEVSLA